MIFCAGKLKNVLHIMVPFNINSLLLTSGIKYANWKSNANAMRYLRYSVIKCKVFDKDVEKTFGGRCGKLPFERKPSLVLDTI